MKRRGVGSYPVVFIPEVAFENPFIQHDLLITYFSIRIPIQIPAGSESRIRIICQENRYGTERKNEMQVEFKG